jgi:transcriptional repressor NrdR
MKCPFCQHEHSKVNDKRDYEDAIRRRRECLKCKKRYTTYEKIGSISLNVIKKDGRKEPFDHEKLKKGIIVACEKRPITMEKIDDTINKIESELRRLKTNEIQSTQIGEKILCKLKKLDDVAYIRFLSVFNSFENVNEFNVEVKKLKKEAN